MPDGVATGAAALFPAPAVRVTAAAVAEAKIAEAAEGGMVVVMAVDDSTSVALAVEELELAGAEAVEEALDESEADVEDEPDEEEPEEDESVEDEPEDDEPDEDEDEEDELELDDEVRTSEERPSTLVSMNAMVGPATTEFVARTTTSKSRGWLSLVM